MEDKITLTSLISKDDYLVCCICRNENKYLEEFCNHYFNLGFTKIVLCDNAKTENDERILDLPYIQNLLFNGKCMIQIDDSNKYQLPFYEIVANDLDYKYCLFVDADEFLILENHDTIQDYIDCIGDCDGILFNWKMYGHNNQLCYQNKPIMKRFKEPIKDDVANQHYKILLKKQKDKVTFPNPHIIDKGKKYDLRNAKGEKITDFSNCQGAISLNEPIHSVAWINHYFTKSLEEFVSKIKKGRACADGNKDLNQFLNYGEKTPFLENLIQTISNNF